MPRVELKLEHYLAIRDFMDDIELDPEDAMSPIETESLGLVKQIISNIETRRKQPSAPRKNGYPYRKRRVA